MARIVFSSPLKHFTNGLESCEVGGSIIGEATRQIGEMFPLIKDKFLREDGTLRAFFIIFVDDKDIRMLERELTPVGSESVIGIVPAIAGG